MKHAIAHRQQHAEQKRQKKAWKLEPVNAITPLSDSQWAVAKVLLLAGSIHTMYRLSAIETILFSLY